MWLLCSIIIHAQEVYISNLRQVSNDTNEFQGPKWSPDGTKIIVTGHKKQGLYVIKLDSSFSMQNLTDESGAGVNYSWSANGSVNYTVKNDDFQPVQKFIPLGGQYKSAQSQIDTVLYIDPDLIIKAKLSDGSEEWVVTECEGSFYNPLISPDKKKVAVNNGAEIWVFPIEGSNSYINLGIGIVSSWSPDSKYILAFIDESPDGEYISNAEMFLLDVEFNKKLQLTESAEIIEMWPSFSPDGKKIAFSELKSGQIFICDFNIKK